MNDYFLKILIQQRHAQMLAEARAAKLSQRGRFRAIRGNKPVRLFGSFVARCKKLMVVPPPVANGRNSV